MITSTYSLPPADSSDIQLTHPTNKECLKIWELSSLAWRDALTLPQYLEESAFLTTVPLAKDGGMTIWLLTDNTLPADQRPILAACESFRKRSLISSPEGQLTETIVHGIASVFTDPALRRRGYAARLMTELGKALESWQADGKGCIGSVLYSDIGKKYYGDLGWHPFPNNNHIEFAPSPLPSANLEKLPQNVGDPSFRYRSRSSPRTQAKPLLAADLAKFCQEDENMIRKRMSRPAGKLRMVIMPDLDHMLWHHTKEEFACARLFGKIPKIKGAVVGKAGHRIWAIWTHRYYGNPSSSNENTLYILRLVIENELDACEDLVSKGTPLTAKLQEAMVNLKAVIEAAQAEAAEWKLSFVNLWDPSSSVQELIKRTAIQHRKVDREDESIASLRWYGKGSGKEDMLDWVANEKFAWC